MTNIISCGAHENVSPTLFSLPLIDKESVQPKLKCPGRDTGNSKLLINIKTQGGHFYPPDIFANISQTTRISVIMYVCGTLLEGFLRDILGKKNLF